MGSHPISDGQASRHVPHLQPQPMTHVTHPYMELPHTIIPNTWHPYAESPHIMVPHGCMSLIHVPLYRTHGTRQWLYRGAFPMPPRLHSRVNQHPTPVSHINLHNQYFRDPGIQTDPGGPGMIDTGR